MQFNIEIKHRKSNEVLFAWTGEADNEAKAKGEAIRAALTRGTSLAFADLSGAYLSGARLSGATLTYANLTSANLADANLTGARLTLADLTLANLTLANLTDANLTRANLAGANLSDANLSDANLSAANLSRADLTGANLAGAIFSFDVPVIENVHQQVYNAASRPGALRMDDWHTCDTTHCRAGWVVTLAGKAGLELEAQTSTLLAAYLIYRASGYEIDTRRFFDANETALEDMRRLAEAEAAA